MLHTNQTPHCPLTGHFWMSLDSMYLLIPLPNLILWLLISTQSLHNSPPATCLFNTHSSLKRHFKYYLFSNPFPTQLDGHVSCESPLTPTYSKLFRNETEISITAIHTGKKTTENHKPFQLQKKSEEPWDLPSYSSIESRSPSRWGRNSLTSWYVRNGSRNKW